MLFETILNKNINKAFVFVSFVAWKLMSARGKGNGNLRTKHDLKLFRQNQENFVEAIESIEKMIDYWNLWTFLSFAEGKKIVACFDLQASLK